MERIENILQVYVNRFKNATTYKRDIAIKEIKSIVDELYNDDRVSDVDFNFMVNYAIIPTLNYYNIDLSFIAEQQNKSVLEILLTENY